jgi:hypothetical protein
VADFLTEFNRIEATKKANELVVIMLDVPPTSISDTLQTQNAKNSFDMERIQNFHIAHRIDCRAKGVETVYPVPEEMKGLVIARTAYLNAKYNLVYECWYDLKNQAKREGLILEDGQPKDFFKLLLDTQYIEAFTNLDNDQRTSEQQRNSQSQRIATHNNAHKKCLELNSELSNPVPPSNDPSKSERENKKILAEYWKKLDRRKEDLRRGWMHDYQKLTRPAQLLIDTADRLSKTSAVVATAKDYFLNALKDKLQAESDCFRVSYLESLKK